MDSEATLQAVNLSVILMCIIQRLPQIRKVMANGSTQGLDVLGLSLELWCFLTVCDYAASQRYPFLTYCEDLFLSAQVVLLLFLIANERGFRAVYIGFYISGFAVVQLGILFRFWPLGITMLIVNSLAVMSAVGKSRQIFALWRSRHVRNLSAPTWFIAFTCSSARIVSTLLSTRDSNLLTLYGINGCLNFGMAASITYLSVWAGKNE